MKLHGLTVQLLEIRYFLRAEEENGIPSVAVKCVDIGKNTGGEGGSLVCL